MPISNWSVHDSFRCRMGYFQTRRLDKPSGEGHRAREGLPRVAVLVNLVEGRGSRMKICFRPVLQPTVACDQTNCSHRASPRLFASRTGVNGSQARNRLRPKPFAVKPTRGGLVDRLIPWRIWRLDAVVSAHAGQAWPEENSNQTGIPVFSISVPQEIRSLSPISQIRSLPVATRSSP